jgi:hypothetical protein
MNTTMYTMWISIVMRTDDVWCQIHVLIDLKRQTCWYGAKLPSSSSSSSSSLFFFLCSSLNSCSYCLQRQDGIRSIRTCFIIVSFNRVIFVRLYFLLCELVRSYVHLSSHWSYPTILVVSRWNTGRHRRVNCLLCIRWNENTYRLGNELYQQWRLYVFIWLVMYRFFSIRISMTSSY